MNCVCHSIRSMFRVLGVYNFGFRFTVHKEKDKFVKKNSRNSGFIVLVAGSDEHDQYRLFREC